MVSFWGVCIAGGEGICISKCSGAVALGACNCSCVSNWGDLEFRGQLLGSPSVQGQLLEGSMLCVFPASSLSSWSAVCVTAMCSFWFDLWSWLCVTCYMHVSMCAPIGKMCPSSLLAEAKNMELQQLCLPQDGFQCHSTLKVKQRRRGVCVKMEGELSSMIRNLSAEVLKIFLLSHWVLT